MLNCNRGPWLGGAFRDQKAEALMDYLQALEHDPAEQAQYHDLVCFDLGIDPADAAPAHGHDHGALAPAIAQWLDSSTFTNRCPGAGA